MCAQRYLVGLTDKRIIETLLGESDFLDGTEHISKSLLKRSTDKTRPCAWYLFKTTLQCVGHMDFSLASYKNMYYRVRV